MSFDDFVVFYTAFGLNSRLVDYSHKVDKRGKAKAEACVAAIAKKLNADVCVTVYHNGIYEKCGVYQACAAKGDLSLASNLEVDVGCAYLQVLVLLMGAAGIKSLTELEMVLDLYAEGNGNDA